MRFERNIPWDDCMRLLREAGFVCAAESPAAVVLVSGGRSVVLKRVPAFDEPELVAALEDAGLRRAGCVALLWGIGSQP